MLASILFAALLAQGPAQPAAMAPVETRREDGVMFWQNPPHCEVKATTVHGPTPERALPLIAIVDERRLMVSRGVTIKPIWRPQDHPNAGVYAPVVRMVDGCMVPVVKVLEADKHGR